MQLGRDTEEEADLILFLKDGGDVMWYDIIYHFNTVTLTLGDKKY